MSDHQDRDVKVVIRSDVRSVRIMGEQEMPYFGASGSEDGNLTTLDFQNGVGHTQADDADSEGAVVREEAVHELDATIRAQADLIGSEDDQSDDDMAGIHENTM
ncbi:hypothetical protein M758_UG119500 [Ceratodon purpureus]|nr:hypothetical protein M758_UG119500 [Ceratodon purpureus]